ncbi:hypothetical protein ANN_05924 [Periplaneta americana]|uniref:Uncharacterized protein n=1 Tax=Periplaneta americana TaxID=6978 RepID=A0ABQ8TEL4_PERAM|nr:hypothetical protein ANN_05924 [Periplaneta americana]
MKQDLENMMTVEGQRLDDDRNNKDKREQNKTSSFVTYLMIITRVYSFNSEEGREREMSAETRAKTSCTIQSSREEKCGFLFAAEGSHCVSKSHAQKKGFPSTARHGNEICFMKEHSCCKRRISSRNADNRLRYQFIIHLTAYKILNFCKIYERNEFIQIRENTGILLEASKEIGLEVNPEKTNYMIMSRDENIVRNGNIKIGNLSFEEVEKFKYLGATVTNINDTREEIKHRINMGNACYYSVEKLLSSSLLWKNLKVRIYKTVILPVFLYGCETWTLTLREEQRLRVFENKILRKIFGAKRDEVTGEWRKLHNAELHALYSSPDIIRNIKSRRLRWAGHVARMDESRNAYRVLVGRPEGKRLLGRPRRRWEDNIKMNLREVGYDDREWINFAHDRDQWRAYVRAAMNLRVP